MFPKDALDLQARPAYANLIFFEPGLAFAAPHAIDGRVRIAPSGHAETSMTTAPGIARRSKRVRFTKTW